MKRNTETMQYVNARKVRVDVERTRKEFAEAVAREAAEDLRFRIAVIKDPEHPNRVPADVETPDEAVIVAWLTSHFDIGEDAERALLETLDLKWVTTRSGARVLIHRR